MIYKLLVNYIRIKLVKIIFNQFMSTKSNKQASTGHLKTMNLLNYTLEFLVSYWLQAKKRK